VPKKFNSIRQIRDRDVTVKLLTDAQATKEEILDGLDWIQKETTARDVAVVFLAGHGVNDPAGLYYYPPSNAAPDRLERTCLPFSDIKNTVSSLAGKVVMFVDTCHAGNVMGGRRSETDITGAINELASAARQNGAFTKALVGGIGGKADYSGKGKITINTLDLYLSERVKELTQGRQTPTTTKPETVPDFPIAARR
jgi:uncharacterized caspase-like protein